MKVLLACGGTGGHLFPGIALAEMFEQKSPQCELVFVGTDRGIEGEVIPKTRWSLEKIEVPTMADKKGLKKVLAVGSLLKTALQVHRLLKKIQPDIVISLGGYVGGPVGLMAGWKKIPVGVVEPNAMPGMGNIWAAKFAKKVFLAFEAARKYFSPDQVVLSGVPVRKTLLAEFKTIVRETEPFVLFVFGGSQGASKLNETMVAALKELDPVKEKLHIIHQIGKKADLAAISKRYRELGFSHEIYPFIQNMGIHYGRAHLVLARAGASTVTELMATGRASILVPYPHSAAGHQRANAVAMVSQGFAKKIEERDLNGSILAQMIRDSLEHPEALAIMERKLQQLNVATAAEKIVNQCLEWVGV